MTTYLVTGKLHLNRRTGRIRGAIPAKTIDGLISDKHTPRKVKIYWGKRISKPIQSTKLKCLFKKGHLCNWYSFDQGNKLIKIEKPK